MVNDLIQELLQEGKFEKVQTHYNEVLFNYNNLIIENNKMKQELQVLQLRYDKLAELFRLTQLTQLNSWTEDLNIMNK